MFACGKLSGKYEIGLDLSMLFNVAYPRACLSTGKYLLQFTSTTIFSSVLFVGKWTPGLRIIELS